MKGTLARVGRQAGFAGSAPPDSWPRPRSVPRPERLEAGVESLHGVGATLARRLARIGLETVGDLLWQGPRRYEEPVPSKRICDLFGEEEAVIEVVVRSASSRRRGRLRILTARVADATGEVKVTWFNQPWLEERLSPGTRIRLRGRANRYGFAVSSYDLEGEESTADFAPVYPASEDLAQKRLRDLHSQALVLARDAGEPLPAALLTAERLPLRADALAAVHRPRALEEAEAGRARLAFDELLVLRLALARTATERERTSAVPLGVPGELLARYRASLPFTLTPDQERSIAEIDADLGRSIPMQRLLHGDVGSGKTVVALYALLRAVELGRQGALMAPTETLAEQHFLTMDELCAPLGVRVSLLTSSLRAREHVAARQLIASGDAQIVVGTHALIQKEVDFHDLGVAVVDEQHRFGVGQRTALVEGRSPHVLHLTATPIPRTLALTVYGDLEVSELALPPANRKPVITAWVTEERSSEAYKRLRRHLDDGRQAYVVCPLIEESETRIARAAEAEAERIRSAELRGYRVGCLHGRLPSAKRRSVMASFKAGELDVLVATTV
ncbi:MAG: DEAD/DEAH box helicase, partial [Actinomycetota bacterium]